MLERVATDRNSIHAAGARSRIAFEQHYDRPIGAARVATILGLNPAAHAIPPEPYLAVANA
jgi:hypothetical protein